MALLTLAYVVDDTELELLELDHNLLHFCLQLLEVALQDPGKKSWYIDELLVGLSQAARLDFNRRLLVATGKTTCPLLIFLRGCHHCNLDNTEVRL